MNHVYRLCMYEWKGEHPKTDFSRIAINKGARVILSTPHPVFDCWMFTVSRKLESELPKWLTYKGQTEINHMESKVI